MDLCWFHSGSFVFELNDIATSGQQGISATAAVSGTSDVSQDPWNHPQHFTHHNNVLLSTSGDRTNVFLAKTNQTQESRS